MVASVVKMTSSFGVEGELGGQFGTVHVSPPVRSALTLFDILFQVRWNEVEWMFRCISFNVICEWADFSIFWKLFNFDPNSHCFCVYFQFEKVHKYLVFR